MSAFPVKLMKVHFSVLVIIFEKYILNIVTEPPFFKDVDIQTLTEVHDPMAPTEVHNPMVSTWIKATIRNDVAQQ